ncbi:sensor histidine kinase TmoS [Kordia sp. SMS9]|uniref:hybrid sensor histidine kinase/response regulator transcription factor n=1 Tax=Kordia sp. SMS9 TaxID=2282170 RepID=UPI000E0CE705|nr:ATP-binding protein [Kordia sp. SMS9]AXG70670.1 sensor histidine kinase TmoS [Kordia sp. SMS9]
MKIFKIKHVTYFTILLTSCVIYGQKSQNKTPVEQSYTNQIENEYLSLLQIEHRISKDSFKLRVEKLLSTINNERSHKSDSLKGQLLMDLSYYHARNQTYDSVKYFFKQISDHVKNYYVLADAHDMMSKVSFNEEDFEAYLFHINKGLAFSKKYTKSRLSKIISLNIFTFYVHSKRYDLAKEILRELKKSITKSTKFDVKYQINRTEATLKFDEGKFMEALDILKKYENSEITKSVIYADNFYMDLSKIYSKLKRYDTAFNYFNKISNTNHPRYLVQLATLHYENKDYNLALNFLNKIPNTYLLKHDYEYFDVMYKVHKSLGNIDISLEYLEKLTNLKEERQKKLTEHQYAIFSYELKKDKEINRLKAEKKIQEALNVQNEKKFKYQLFIGLILIASIFTILLLIYKKRQEKKRILLEQHTEINKLKTQYIENITHEIKTPVSVNLGYLELIKNNALDTRKIIDYVDTSIRINHKLLSTLNDLLTFIKLDSTNTLAKDFIKEQNLFNFLFTEIKKFKHSCYAKDLTIKLITNIKSDYIFKFDYSKLEKILDNLLTNAIKFSKIEKTISVTFLLCPDHIKIEVIDEGIGIDQKLHDKIFERFYQIEQNENSGFGIGLFLVKNIIDTWNGNIKVDSEPDKGTTFTTIIPVANIELKESRNEITEINYFQKKTDEIKNPDGDVTKILIVENQLEMINYLSHIFAIDYYCDFAYDGKQAYKLINKSNYKLIISDYKMPNMDGLELKSELDKNPETKKIPFILISASDIEDKLDRFNKRESFLFLKKPFTEFQLKLFINTLIGQKINAKNVTSINETTSILKDDSITTFLQKVNTYILKNLDNDELKIGDIAQHIGYSQKQFTNILNEYTNLNPTKVVLEIRLLKAYEFIKSKRYKTISEVMIAIGINSRPYFYKAFEKRFGIKVGKIYKENNF